MISRSTSATIRLATRNSALEPEDRRAEADAEDAARQRADHPGARHRHAVVLGDPAT